MINLKDQDSVTELTAYTAILNNLTSSTSTALVNHAEAMRQKELIVNSALDEDKKTAVLLDKTAKKLLVTALNLSEAGDMLSKSLNALLGNTPP